jgi:tetratricopeptide (TPR) repeat protein
LQTAVNDYKFKQKILVELAYAEFDLNNVDEAEDYCKKLLEDQKLDNEEKEKCYTLLGIIEIQFRSNPEQALKKFILAEQIYLPQKMAGRTVRIKINIGNIYSMIGEKKNAEKYWDKAVELNRTIGDLGQEAYILLNYGVFYHENNNLEKANESWLQSEKIFTALGNQSGIGLSLSNLGEVYLQTCDYQNAYDNLNKALVIFNQLKNKEEALNVIYVLGKFWFIIGESEELEKIINQYEYSLFTEDNNSERNNLIFNYLKLLVKINNNESSELLSEISSLLEMAIRVSEVILYMESVIRISEHLINLKKFDEALFYLSDKDFVKNIEQNVIFKAQREYLFGRIAYYTQNEDLKSPLEYYENAYNLIEDESISELTWKTLSTIAENYWERGNFHKAKKPRHYAYELINMIGENITNSKIRSAYFNHPERKKALEKLVLIGNQTQLNEYQKS